MGWKVETHSHHYYFFFLWLKLELQLVIVLNSLLLRKDNQLDLMFGYFCGACFFFSFFFLLNLGSAFKCPFKFYFISCKKKGCY